MSNDNYKRDEHGNMYWTEYYKDLNIPSDWENISAMMSCQVLVAMAIPFGLTHHFLKREKKTI